VQDVWGTRGRSTERGGWARETEGGRKREGEGGREGGRGREGIRASLRLRVSVPITPSLLRAVDPRSAASPSPASSSSRIRIRLRARGKQQQDGFAVAMLGARPAACATLPRHGGRGGPRWWWWNKPQGRLRSPSDAATRKDWRDDFTMSIKEAHVCRAECGAGPGARCGRFKNVNAEVQFLPRTYLHQTERLKRS
jgi:hypothetical protein